jgi:hypothetical protein
MFPIYADWALNAVLAAAIGYRRPKVRWSDIAVIGAIALVGWVATFPLVVMGTRYGGDVAIAEDYLNGLSLATGVLDFVVWIGWTLVWFVLGKLIRWSAGAC